MFKILGLKYKIRGSELKVLEQNSITQNSKNQFECEFEFSDEWDKLTKFCVFEVKGHEPVCVEIEDNKCMVSTTVTKFSNFKTGVFGINENSTFTTNTSMIFTGSSISTDGGVDDDITKSLYEQFILDAIVIRDEAKDYANSASKAVEQYPKVTDGLLYFWDNENQEFVQTNFQDGLSAYELATKQGFEGTIREWIENLKGDKGDAGEQGIQGEKGDGFVYEDFTEEQLEMLKGDTGKQGVQGEKGDTGDAYELTDKDKQEIAEISQEEVANARISFEGEVQDSLDERINTDIAMLLDRFNSATSIPYEGESITATNSYLGMTNGLEIQGQTYSNLAKLSSSVSEVFTSTQIGVSLSDSILTIVEQSYTRTPYYKYNLNRYKSSTTYTIIANVISNTCYNNFYVTRNDSGDTSPVIISNFIIPARATGVFKQLVTTRADISTCTSAFKLRTTLVEDADLIGAISYSFMILEGDYTNIDLPDDVNDIESVLGNLIMTSSNLDYSMDQINYENIELRRIGDIFDSICNNQLIQRIGVRDYIDGDLELENVLVNNDLTTTYYILDEPIITELDTKELKTYDGTTHIKTSGTNIKPIISARIPSDVGAVIASVSAENQQLMIENQALTSELSETNGILDTLLTVE